MPRLITPLGSRRSACREDDTAGKGQGDINAALATVKETDSGLRATTGSRRRQFMAKHGDYLCKHIVAAEVVAQLAAAASAEMAAAAVADLADA